jgi:uncharacterized protein YciI
MQFLLVAYDFDDADAPNRRLAAREAHLALVAANKAAGHALYGAALVEDGKMVGSMLVIDYESREALEEWLAEEPYITGKVWDEISISECRVAPAFAKL